MIVTIYEATHKGKRPLGKIESRNGELIPTGDTGRLVEDLKSGELKVLIVDRLYRWEDGEEFLKHLPMALHGAYLWAEVTG